MTKSFLSLLLGAFLSLSLGCASRTILASDHWAQPAENVPEHFMVGKYNGFEMTEPIVDDGCRSPMIDPRDSTKVSLFRSFNGRGDYEVPEGKYGVKKGQILRLDCASGKVVGIFEK